MATVGNEDGRKKTPTNVVHWRHYLWEKPVWRYRSTELSNGSVTQSAISSKRKADAPNVPSIFLWFFRRMFGRMHAVHLINACVVGISKGNWENIPFGFEQRVILPQAVKCERFSIIAKQTQAEIRDYKLSMVNHKCESYELLTRWLLKVINFLLNIGVFLLHLSRHTTSPAFPLGNYLVFPIR